MGCSTYLGLGWRYQPLAPGHPTSICDIGVNSPILQREKLMMRMMMTMLIVVVMVMMTTMMMMMMMLMVVMMMIFFLLPIGYRES